METCQEKLDRAEVWSGAVSNICVYGMCMHDDASARRHRCRAGPTKADGSPNMSIGANIRVRDMLKPPALRFPPTDEGESQAASSETEIARDIAAQLRLAATAIAPYLAWIMLVLALALFHELTS